eukprot:1442931-Rhodomonas_salina.1
MACHFSHLSSSSSLNPSSNSRIWASPGGLRRVGRAGNGVWGGGSGRGYLRGFQLALGPRLLPSDYLRGLLHMEVWALAQDPA